MNLSKILTAAVLFSTICFFTDVSAQQSDQMITRFAPDECTLFFGWTGELKADASGMATERWLAQKEIQASMIQLENAIEEYLEADPFEIPAIGELVAELPWLLMQKPFAIYFSDIDPSVSPPEMKMGAVMELGDKAPWMAKLLGELVKGINEHEPESTQFKSEQTDGFQLFVTRQDGNEFYFGVADGNFVAAYGKGEIKRLLGNLKSGEPDWIKKTRKDIPTKRLAGMFRLNVEDIWEIVESQDAPLPEELYLQEIKEVVGIMDLHQDEMVTTTLLRCPQKTRGILSAVEKPLSLEQVAEIPAGVNSAFAFRFSIDKAWELVQVLAREFQFNDLDQYIQNIEQDTGLDFEKEILGSLEGTFLTAAKLDLVNPMGGNLMSIKIKDPAAFKPRFEAINSAIEDEADFDQGMEYSTAESNGITIHNVASPTLNFFWCLVDDQILLALDKSALRSQLRKRKRAGGKLVEDPRIKSLFNRESDPTGNPVALTYTDFAAGIRVALPSLGAVLGDRTPHPDFGFSLRDLPTAEVLANGVIPNVAAVYRMDAGFKMVEHHVLPGNSSIAMTGVGIGMLLPAVQATRHAARRTMSMNNMRQLVLASLNYEMAHQSYPAAYTKNKEGKKLLSWRVHLLPYLEEQELYDQFHLDEPWDSPYNKKLIAKMPATFENPALPLEEGMTTYLGVTGEDSGFAAPANASENGEMTKGVTLGQVTDGTSNTLLIVDVNLDNAVIWTRPDDLDPTDHDDIRSALSGTWGKGIIIAARCDGSVSIHGREVSDEQLRQMMKKSDGKSGE